jgi:hypothetical protein
MRENELQRDVRAALARTRKVLIFRNNVGVHVDIGVRYGLAPGSSDLIGCCMPSGRFFAGELKVKGRHPTPEQAAFITAINQAGGYACLIRSVEEALMHLEKATAGELAPAVTRPVQKTPASESPSDAQQKSLNSRNAQKGSLE